ncbi:MAG: T9SS type A sorting domain-containing protein [Lewinellaceae bacterium]|nr:T9SS type A sorting domain-containing protein [Lewinellaceae bacterium]
MEIFPNPSSGDFYVKNPFGDAYAQLRVLDLNDKTVWEKHGTLPEQIEVSTIPLSPGIYFVELKSAAQTRLGKLVVVE